MGYFYEFETREEWTYLSIFCLFSRIWDRKNWTYCSIFSYLMNSVQKGVTLLSDFFSFSPVWEQKRINLFLDFWQFSIARNEFICRLKTIFRKFGTRKGLNLLLGYGLYITTKLSPEIVARKLVAVKFIPLQKWPPYDPLRFVRELNGKFFYFLKGSTGRQLRFTQQNDFTANEHSWFAINTLANRIHQEINLRRLKQRLLEVDFRENPWLNTSLSIAQ